MNIMFFLLPKAQTSFLYHDQTLTEGLEFLNATGYTAVPLITREGKYLGTVTEGDFLRALIRPEIWQQRDILYMDQLERRVNIKPVRADAQVRDLIETVLQQNFVPVIDDRNCFIGIVTRQKMLGHLVDEVKKHVKSK